MVFSRRDLLSAAAIGIVSLPSKAFSDDSRPAVTNPRATDGDHQHEPKWDEQLTITVGQSAADIIGRDDKAIQAAVDYVARFGSGTVKILPGLYRLRNAVHLPSKIRLLGSGSDSILTKIASETVELADDSDWYDQEITLSKSAGFRIGDGVVLQAKNPHDGGDQVIKRTLVARSGNRFKLDDGLRENLWLSQVPTCSSLFPLLTSENHSDILIEDLTLDGNHENNANFDGNYGGNIFLQDCNRITIRNVESRNYNGDGISFQVCHDVIVENCFVHGNRGNGLHPGSGSQRPLMRGNRLEQNNIGLFWCWGVKYGLAENNTVLQNASYGMSIGHNDTDNVMRANQISDSGKTGILFRDENRGINFWANRNIVEDNRIINSGQADGVGIDILGRTKDVTIRRNTIQETRAPMNRVGIRINESVERLTLDQNSVDGFSQAIVDARIESSK